MKPGPGTYHPDTEPTRPKSPEWKMGTSSRGDLGPDSKSPGPGRYEYPNSIGKAPKVS